MQASDAFAGRVADVPGEPVDRHHGRHHGPSSLKAAPGSEDPALLFAAGPRRRGLTFVASSLSLSRGAATSVLRAPRHEWNASFGGRCTRETTTGLEWNGPRGSSTGLTQEWGRLSPGPLQGSVWYQGCSYLLRRVAAWKCPAYVENNIFPLAAIIK